MTTAAERREKIDLLRSIPARDRAWLESDDPAIFAYYGFGVLLNSAQETELNNVIHNWPEGSVHVWRWANRSGKTTSLMLLHLFYIWKKWRFHTPDPEGWLNYGYKTLHSSPLNRLMGKAWEEADALIAGRSYAQQDPRTYLQRKARLAPFFEAGSGKNPDGSDALYVRCRNGSKVDFLSTSDGAGRMESDAWWLIDWDEFPRQQPVTDIPILLDQTFWPRSSDFMAPVILAGTDTEDADPVYAEIEDMALSNSAAGNKDWNFSSYSRSVNFTQSARSIARQRRLSFDKAIADRSLEGGHGEGGRASLYPTILLSNAFVDHLPEKGKPENGEIVVSAFDHALAGDLNAVRSWALPWPVPADPDELIGRIRGIAAADKRSSTTLTPNLQFRFVADEVERMGSRYLIVDASAEGGIAVFRMCREARLPVVPFNFTARPSNVKPGLRVTNKEYGLQWLQRVLGWGLDAQANENGWINDWPEIKRAFGLLRMPAEWRRDRRELATLRRDDANLKQDRAMVYVMFAGWLSRYIDHSRPAKASPFNVMARRQRPPMVARR